MHGGIDQPVHLRCHLRRRPAGSGGAGVEQRRTLSLLVAFDTAYPELLYSLRPDSACLRPRLVLNRLRTAATKATAEPVVSRDPADTMAGLEFETLRRSVPTARSLPLLQMLASYASGPHSDRLLPFDLAIEVAE